MRRAINEIHIYRADWLRFGDRTSAVKSADSIAEGYRGFAGWGWAEACGGTLSMAR